MRSGAVVCTFPYSVFSTALFPTTFACEFPWCPALQAAVRALPVVLVSPRPDLSLRLEQVCFAVICGVASDSLLTKALYVATVVEGAFIPGS
jgi:hypothetical protein